MTEKEFATLPPHFVETVLPPLSPEEYNQIMPGYGNFPPSFISVIPFLLASLVYHRKWIEETFDKGHPIFQSRVWTSGLLLKLEPLVQTGCGKNDISGMTASGVPGNIVLANRLFEVEKEVSCLRIVVDNSSASVVKHMTVLFDGIPDKVTAKILENCLIDGAVPLTTRDMETMLSDLKSTIISLVEAGPRSNSSKVDVVQTEDINGEISDKSYCIHYWAKGDVGMHPIPENFEFPK